MFAFGIAFSAMFLASILFITEVWGWSILKAGFGVAPGPALVAVLAPDSAHCPHGSGSDRSSSQVG
jgi:hypothetical protein